MSTLDSESEITIKNKRVVAFYKKNASINIESANLLLIDFMESIFNHMTKDNKVNINAQLLSYITDSKSEIDKIKSNLQQVNDNISKMNSDIANNMMIQFVNLKKDYIDDVRQTVNNSSLSTNEKLTSIMDKNNNHLIDKTSLLLQDIIPKNQDQINKQIQDVFKQFRAVIVEDNTKLAKSMNNENGLQEFINTFEVKYNSMLQSIQQPLYSFFTASEERISKNIDTLKESSTQSVLHQNKVFDELSEFLGKYKGSSNKGKFGENQLGSTLNSMFPNAEVMNTSGQKASGDFIMKRIDRPSILFENKEYDYNIPKDEIAKFIRDVDSQDVNGIFISQNSGITFKQNFQIDVHKGNILVYIQNCEYSTDKIKMAVDIIDSLYVKIQDLNIDEENNTISKEILDDINTEYQEFIGKKETMITFLKDFQKKMITQIEDLRLPALDKYLEPKYAYVKSHSFVCDLCNVFTAGSKQSLAAHKRGCSKKQKKNALTPENKIVVDTK